MRRVAVAGLEVSVLVGTDLVDGICSTRESGELSFVSHCKFVASVGLWGGSHLVRPSNVRDRSRVQGLEFA